MSVLSYMNDHLTIPAASAVHEMSALPTPGKRALALLLTKPNHSIEPPGPIADEAYVEYPPDISIVGDQCVVTKKATQVYHDSWHDFSGPDTRTEDLCQFPVAALQDALTQITPGGQAVVHTRANYVDRTTINGGLGYVPGKEGNVTAHEEEEDTTLFLSLSGDMQRAILRVCRGVPEKPYVTVTSTDEAMRQFPFLRDILIERNGIPPEISTSELDDKFLSQSLLEEESEAAGHFNEKKTLYVVRGDNKLHSVDVRRSPTRIYPPEYLHPGMDFPPDESGRSETVREALSRQDLTEARYIVLHTTGWNGWKDRVNIILIASVKK